MRTRIIYISFVLLNSLVKDDAKKIIRESPCGSSLNLLDCDLDDPSIFSRRYLNKIKVQYVMGNDCNIKKVSFHWDIILENKTTVSFDYYKHGDIFHLKPYMVGAGKHHFVVYAIEIYENLATGSLSHACTFIIIPENPVPIIRGGIERTVESGKSLVLDGSDSIDMEVPSNQKGHLKYRWNCSVKGNLDGPPNFCESELPRDSVITVPAKYIVNNLVYTFDLSVKSRESVWFKFQQRINIKTNASVLKIGCLKNCPPLVLVVNVKEATIFQVECVTNCQNVNKKFYSWSINKDDFNYDKNTEFGRNTDVFFIKENVLELNTNYTIKVALQGNLVGETSLTIVTHKPPELEMCVIFPEKGEALITEFAVHCDHPKGQYVFEVYSINEHNTEILLERSSRLQNIIFVLSYKSKVKVKMVDEYEYYDFQILNVQVDSYLDTNLPTKDLIEEIRNTFFDEHSVHSFDAVMKDQYYDTVIQMSDVFVKELAAISANTDSEAILFEFKLKVLDILKKIPLDTRDRIKQVSAISKEIGELTMLSQDPNIAKEATEICKETAKQFIDSVEQERFIGSFTEEILEDVKIFSDCSQVGLNPNLELLEIPEIPMLSTSFPLLDFPVIKENYPDYVDDENISKALSKLEIYTENLVELCFLNGRALLDTLVPYEIGRYVQNEFFNVTTKKNYGKDIVLAKILSHKIILQPSKDFLGYGNEEIDILLCTSTKNPYWWQNNQMISSSVAMLRFKTEEKIINKFSKPFIISFEKSTNETSILLINGVTPRRPNNTKNNEDYSFEKMMMYRIDIYKNQDYFIEFVELNNYSLQVYVTEYYKPSFQKFTLNSVVVNTNKTKLFIKNNKNYDHWDYLTILPLKEMGNIEVNFTFKIYTISCYNWNNAHRKWEFSCKSSSTSTVQNVVCLCYKSSVLAAWVRNNVVREEHTLYIEHKLEIQACYVIFLTVLVVWIFYSGILVYFSITLRLDKNQEIYFLSDIPSFYRYGYILIVKTGNKSNAGTTSNIFIKLVGKSSETKEHILNYPDPDKKLLQKNQEDWFFLASEYYLGDIEKMEIWFDSMGHSPSWYCSEIEVIDLQMKNYWWFLVNFRFEIKDREKYMYTALPVNNGNVKKSKTVINRFKNALHGRHMWNICDEDKSLSSITRSTIMLSIFLTDFTLMLLFYGLPLLKPSDAIGAYIKYELHKKIIWTSLTGSILTFLIHYPLVYFFRQNSSEHLEPKKSEKLTFKNSFICWAVLIFFILVSMTVTLIFGFWVPHVTSLLWLTSSVSSLLIYIFLLENMMLIFNNLSVKSHNRIEQIFNKSGSLIKFIETQRDVFYEKFGNFSLRPYFKNLYKPLDPAKITGIKYWAKSKQKLFEIFEDILMITVYLFLLYMIILRDKDFMTPKSNKEIKDLIQGEHSKNLPDTKRGIQGIENYIENTLIHYMQCPEWYGKFLSKDPGMTIDNSNKYIGIARLRQHRSENVSCHVVTQMRFVRNDCVSEFSESPEHRDFSERWKNDSESDPFARMDSVWKYREFGDTGTVGFVGAFSSYPGGGYVATLGRTFKNSLINANYLFRNSWLNIYTRCVFIEFLTYSTNSNIFNSITAIFEISLTGYIKSTYNVHTARLLMVDENNPFLWTMFASFIIIVVLLTLKLMKRLIKNKKILLKDIWLAVDILIILLSFSCTFLYGRRSELVGAFLSRIEKAKHNEFVPYFHLFYSETVLISLGSFLIFFGTLRLWKLMRCLLVIRIVEKTLSFAIESLICVCLCQMHFTVLFGITGFLIFGNELYDFKDFFRSYTNLFLASLGFFGFEFGMFRSYLQYVFFICYTLFSLLISTFYMVILAIYYGQAKIYYSNFHEYNVLSYVKENFEYYKEIWKVRCKKRRLRGGEDRNIRDNQFVYPKSDEYRYANSLTLEKSKMILMRQIALNVLRNVNKNGENITKNDVDLIKKTIVVLYKDYSDIRDMDFFFLTRQMDAQKTSLIDNEVFLKMETIVNQILARSKVKREDNLYNKIMRNNNMQFDRIVDNLNIVKRSLYSVVLD